MKRALENRTDNAGFLRDTAHLAVVVVQSEDDCSSEDVADYIAALRVLKENGRDVMIAGIVGLDTPARIQELVGAFSPQSELVSVCQDPAACAPDYANALLSVAHLVRKGVGEHCMEGVLADADASTPAIEPDCLVAEIRDIGAENEEEVPIPPCDATGATPCYRVVPDSSCSYPALYPSQLALQIHRGDTEPPANTRVVTRCRLDPGGDPSPSQPGTMGDVDAGL
jgi:hypothetical protein